MDWVKVAFREDSFDEENEVGGRFLKDVVDNLVGEGHARAAIRERREGAREIEILARGQKLSRALQSLQQVREARVNAEFQALLAVARLGEHGVLLLPPRVFINVESRINPVVLRAVRGSIRNAVISEFMLPQSHQCFPTVLGFRQEAAPVEAQWSIASVPGVPR